MQKEQWVFVQNRFFTVIFTHLFFNSIAVLFPNSRHEISLPTDRISPRRSRHSLASPYPKQRCKKNGEFLSRIDFLQWFLLTIFNSIAVAVPNSRRGISPPTDRLGLGLGLGCRRVLLTWQERAVMKADVLWCTVNTFPVRHICGIRGHLVILCSLESIKALDV